jgi:hypothetical protein
VVKKPARRKTAVAASPRNIPGPLAAGDVYAVRYREDCWGAAYCHAVSTESGQERGLIELLDLLSPVPPTADQVTSLAISPRRDGSRTLQWCNGLLKTPGVKRIAVGVPSPCAIPERETFSFNQAAGLSWEGISWHFNLKDV